MKFILLVSLIAFGQGYHLKGVKESEQRIVGGLEVDIGKHGYQISLREKSIFNPQTPYRHVCGGSIYSENIVLTAAHCIIATVPSQLMVVAGTNFYNGNDGVAVPVKDIIMHENYNLLTFDSDVAILVLSVPLPLNKLNIWPIELIDSAPIAGIMTTITGWGTLEEGGSQLSSTLQEVKVPVVSNDDCNADYEGYITEYMMCAGLRNGGKDACQGDSGGPLTIRNKLAGIVSWGNGCARPNYPGVYANVWTLRPWILEKISQIN